MIYVTDAKNKSKIAINPDHVVLVGTVGDGEFANKTVIALPNGQIIVDEIDYEVVGLINGYKK
jgi:hypothetical protein